MVRLQARILRWAKNQNWDDLLAEEARYRYNFESHSQARHLPSNGAIRLRLHRKRLAMGIRNRYYAHHSGILAPDLGEIDFVKIAKIVFHDCEESS